LHTASIGGLTTAACHWIATAIGLACGAGLYALAPFVALLAIVSLVFLKKIENRLTKDTYSSLRVWSEDIDDQMNRIETFLANHRLQPLNPTIEKDIRNREIFIGFEIKLGARDTAHKVLENIATIPGVNKVRLE